MNPEELRIFTRVAELASFSRAADELGLTKSRASNAVHEIEAQVGSRLLHRTTRSVRLTEDGEKFLARCKAHIADGDELVDMFRKDPEQLTGRIRISLPVVVAREVVVPNLPDFLARHPLLEIAISTSDRSIDLVQDGFDCAVQDGELTDSDIVARSLGFLPMANAASPSYLKAHGEPKSLKDLDQHWIVHRTPALSFKDAGLRYFDRVSNTYQTHPMRSKITVNGGDSYIAAGIAGLGLIQAPAVAIKTRVEQGLLQIVLPKFTAPTSPVSLIYLNRHHVAPRVQAVMDWIAEMMSPFLAHR